jgi:SAM-dependent methyltransferase
MSFAEHRGGAGDAPRVSPFVAEWIAAHAPGTDQRSRRALDVAMGRGGHAMALARAGFETFGVDVACGLVQQARASSRAEGLSIRAWCADLTNYPLPSRRFDVVVVVRYLQRDLFKSLRATVRPRGVILYETFTTAQRSLGWGPTSPDHLLEPGELVRLFDDFEILFYEEVSAPEAVARIAVRSTG